MTPDLQLVAQSNPRWLQAIRGLVRSYLNNFEFDPERVDNIVLALDEACANVIRHSYEGKPDQPMRLALLSNKSAVTFRLEDDGITAPADKVKPCAPENPDRKNLRPGGLGVQLMYSVFDHVEFCPGKNAGNCVTMRVNRKNSRKED
jgi:anti-sigma regulatory factor (Ser/Thr protein kinase)